MHRSGSTIRASEEYYAVGMAAGTATPPSGAGKGTSAGDHVRRSSSVGGLPESDDLLLPKYDPQSGLAKREAARSRSGESTVHVIPLVLIACALVLWFFSSPMTLCQIHAVRSKVLWESKLANHLLQHVFPQMKALFLLNYETFSGEHDN